MESFVDSNDELTWFAQHSTSGAYGPTIYLNSVTFLRAMNQIAQSPTADPTPDDSVTDP